MIFGIVDVMEIDVIMEELAAHRMVAEPPMHQRLRKRHDRMRRDGGHEKEWKLRKEPRYRLVHHLFLRLQETILSNMVRADGSVIEWPIMSDKPSRPRRDKKRPVPRHRAHS